MCWKRPYEEPSMQSMAKLNNILHVLRQILGVTCTVRMEIIARTPYSGDR